MGKITSLVQFIRMFNKDEIVSFHNVHKIIPMFFPFSVTGAKPKEDIADATEEWIKQNIDGVVLRTLSLHTGETWLYTYHFETEKDCVLFKLWK